MRVSLWCEEYDSFMEGEIGGMHTKSHGTMNAPNHCSHTGQIKREPLQKKKR